MILGMMGGMFLTISTATIDTGIHEGHLHTFCASGFFTFTFYKDEPNRILQCTIKKTPKRHQIVSEKIADIKHLTTYRFCPCSVGNLRRVS